VEDQEDKIMEQVVELEDYKIYAKLLHLEHIQLQ
jgi:hypothetical protein